MSVNAVAGRGKGFRIHSNLFIINMLERWGGFKRCRSLAGTEARNRYLIVGSPDPKASHTKKGGLPLRVDKPGTKRAFYGKLCSVPRYCTISSTDTS